MLQELTIAAQSVTALGTLLKSANTLSNYNEIVTAVSEVSAKLMAANTVASIAQEKQAALSTEINILEQEIMRLKNWEAERNKYKRREISRGVFAYVESEFVGNMESAHKFCCTCFENTIISTLQSVHAHNNRIGNCFEVVCQKGCATIQFRNYMAVENS